MENFEKLFSILDELFGDGWTVDVIAHIFSFMKFESEVVA